MPQNSGRSEPFWKEGTGCQSFKIRGSTCTFIFLVSCKGLQLGALPGWPFCWQVAGAKEWSPWVSGSPEPPAVPTTSATPASDPVCSSPLIPKEGSQPNGALPSERPLTQTSALAQALRSWRGHRCSKRQVLSRIGSGEPQSGGTFLNTTTSGCTLKGPGDSKATTRPGGSPSAVGHPSSCRRPRPPVL